MFGRGKFWNCNWTSYGIWYKKLSIFGGWKNLAEIKYSGEKFSQYLTIMHLLEEFKLGIEFHFVKKGQLLNRYSSVIAKYTRLHFAIKLGIIGFYFFTEMHDETKENS